MKISIRGKGLVIIAFLLGAFFSGLGFYLFSHPTLTQYRSANPSTWYSNKQENSLSSGQQKGALSSSSNEAEQESPEDDINKMMESFFNEKDDFFSNNGGMKDPLQEMHKMHKKMLQNFSGMSFSQSGSEISNHEDDKYIYYEISSKNLDQNSLKININGNMLSVSGEIKQSKEENNNSLNQKSVYISRFQRSFPVPDNVESNKMQVDTTQDKVTIKFPKKIS